MVILINNNTLTGHGNLYYGESLLGPLIAVRIFITNCH